jgi:hypothetical protein
MNTRAIFGDIVILKNRGDMHYRLCLILLKPQTEHITHFDTDTRSTENHVTYLKPLSIVVFYSGSAQSESR